MVKLPAKCNWNTCSTNMERTRSVTTALVIVGLLSIALATERSLNRTDLNCSGKAYANVTISAYYPDFTTGNESDYLDVRMKKLRTLQDFFDDRGEFVTVGMDMSSGIAYGTKVCIPELNTKFGRQIPLQVRDQSRSGDEPQVFPDFSHVDVCVRTEEDTYDRFVNGLVTLYV